MLVQCWVNLFQGIGESLTTHRSSFLLKDLNKLQFLKFHVGHSLVDKPEHLAYYPMLFLTYPFIPYHDPSTSNSPIFTIYAFFPLGSCLCCSIHLEMTFSMSILQTRFNSACLANSSSWCSFPNSEFLYLTGCICEIQAHIFSWISL